jgi:hypothetical protein
MTNQLAFKDFTGNDCATIIEEVKNREFLWDPANKEHKNAKKVYDSWAEIGELLSNGNRNISGSFQFLEN